MQEISKAVARLVNALTELRAHLGGPLRQSQFCGTPTSRVQCYQHCKQAPGRVPPHNNVTAPPSNRRRTGK
jgi:hypothetical protein